MLFRFPGGKKKLSKQIVNSIVAYYKDGSMLPYVEPFFGGGYIGLSVLPKIPSKTVLINDKDAALVWLWLTIREAPETLCKMVMDFKPSPDAFYEFKSMLLGSLADVPKIKAAFAKIAIHQISFSGLGPMSGGPLGGREQKSKYKIDCRWNPETLCQKIRQIHKLFVERNVVCTNLDFEQVIGRSTNAFIYLDPPYYEKGGELYQHAFTHDDHVRLCRLLKNLTSVPWLLSYDDSPAIRELYSFAKIQEISVKYTISTVRTKTELLIAPASCAHLLKETEHFPANNRVVEHESAIRL